MNLAKKMVIGAALALTLTSAQASLISAGGVNWDTEAPTDFTSQAINLRQFIDSTTGALSGFGIITAFNGTGQSTFCPGCELTFQFGGFTPVGGTTVPGLGETISYSGGWVKVFVGLLEIGNPNDYNALTWANTGNGDLFLDLVSDGIFLGTRSIGPTLSGLGLLDVVGGLAGDYFDTNQEQFGADIRFSTSLTFPHGSRTNIYDMSGTANMFGKTLQNEIPEPASLALLGVGLLGMAGLRRRNISK